MSPVRVVHRGSRAYYYLAQTFRWGGKVRRKEIYLGTSLPRSLESHERDLQRQIWADSWFPAFDKIRVSWEALRRAQPTSVVRKAEHDFAIEFTFHSNRIEGSSLTLDEVSLAVDKGVTPRTKPLADVLEARSHAALSERLFRVPERLDLGHLLRWHRELFTQTKPDVAGLLRQYEVRIRGSSFRPPVPLEVRPLVLELLRWNARKAESLHTVERAAEFHVRFERIHPFGDGNGRIGRLATNVILVASGYPPFNVNVPSRRSYLRALAKVEKEGKSRPFVNWFFLHYLRQNQRSAPD